MTDFFDRPRSGIADFEGQPHYFESEWDEASDDYAPTFRLSSFPPALLELVLEDEAIWKRWWIAYYAGLPTDDGLRVLPEDRARHQELDAILRERLVIDPSAYVRVLGEFRTAADWNGEVPAPLEASWQRC